MGFVFLVLLAWAALLVALAGMAVL